MAETIVTEQSKFAPEILSAIERALQSHSLRLKPGASLEEVATKMEGYQVMLQSKHGYLEVSQHGQPIHLSTALESFAERQADIFFPRDVAGVASRDSLDTEGKLKFIREQGLPAWEALPQKAPTQRTVVLDKSRLTRADYLSLDRKTRMELCGLWGDAAIAKVMGRK